MTSAAKWSLGEVVMTGELEHGEAGAGGRVKDGGHERRLDVVDERVKTVTYVHTSITLADGQVQHAR